MILGKLKPPRHREMADKSFENLHQRLPGDAQILGSRNLHITLDRKFEILHPIENRVLNLGLLKFPQLRSELDSLNRRSTNLAQDVFIMAPLFHL